MKSVKQSYSGIFAFACTAVYYWEPSYSQVISKAVEGDSFNPQQMSSRKNHRNQFKILVHWPVQLRYCRAEGAQTCQSILQINFLCIFKLGTCLTLKNLLIGSGSMLCINFPVQVVMIAASVKQGEISLCAFNIIAVVYYMYLI